MAGKKPNKQQKKIKPVSTRSTKTKSSEKTTTSAKKKLITKKKVTVKAEKNTTKITKTQKKKTRPAKRPVATKKIIAAIKARTAKNKTRKKLTPRGKKIQDIKKKLMMQRATLLAEAEEALNSLPGQTIYPDLGDQASAEIDRSFMLRLRGREQKLLKKIDESIDKIDTGSFGICEICGQEIDIKRLEARPVTTMCISCKTDQEEEEKLRGE